ncbi:hypothetical protein [Nocardia cyriacigeorgica]|uniref:hypothetical protein n=1 Tax=Nocardia cyriacigeorgica TaxID=135487 RepID=UPI002455F35B|nr:hypothetical protein [Nocardia cyriacigeorgica]
MAAVVLPANAEGWVVIPWDCGFPGRLTTAEARRVLTEHGAHRDRCRIARTARRVLRTAEAANSRG